MTVPKDDTMDNDTTAEDYDDFDALLDASSLGAPHVRAECAPIPAEVNRRLRSARTHHAHPPQLHDEVAPDDDVIAGSDTSEETPDASHSQDRDRGTVLFLSTGSGKTHALLSRLLQEQRESEPPPRIRLVAGPGMPRATGRESPWSGCQELWDLLMMGCSTTSQWAQLTTTPQYPARTWPVPTEYAGRGPHLITTTHAAGHAARFLDERLRTHGDTPCPPTPLDWSARPGQVTRWQLLEELIASDRDVAKALRAEDDRTLEPLCPHEHRTRDQATKQPPPCSAAARRARLAVAWHHLARLDAFPRLLMPGMAQSVRQEGDLTALQVFAALEGGRRKLSALSPGANSTRAHLAEFMAQFMDDAQKERPWAGAGSGAPAWTRPAPLLLRRPTTSAASGRTRAAPALERAEVAQPRSEAASEATALHADLHTAWHADEAQRGIPVPARFTYQTSDPFAITAVFYPREPEETVWTFARDLLTAGMHGSAGEGDVIVWSDHAPATAAAGQQTFIRLRSPEGTALLSLKTTHLADYLERTRQLVPAGTENQRLRSTINDFARELDQCARPGSSC